MIINYAQFGLFTRRELIASGTISEMEKRAIEEVEKTPHKKFFISCIIFDNFDEPTEGEKVLSVGKINDDIIVINELL